MPESASAKHFLPCPWPVHPEKQRAGGIDSVFGAEIVRAERDGIDLTVFSIDSTPWERGSVKVLPAESGDFPKDYFKALFGAGYWPAIHSDAHTSVGAQADVLAAMFEASRSLLPAKSTAPLDSMAPSTASADAVSRVGGDSFAQLVAHVNAVFPRLGDPDVAFNNRFDRLFAGIVPANEESCPHVHFQDFFTAQAAVKHGKSLRERGAFISFHHHESVHPGLVEMVPGQRLLAGMGNADVVLAHTDLYVTRLVEELREAQARGIVDRVPPVQRFDLGIAPTQWDRLIGVVTPENYTTAIPDFASLNARQQKFAHEVLQSRGKVPHRFACFDRVDPNKGTNLVVDSIREFLTSELARGLSMEDLRSTYRFFGAHDLITLGDTPVTDHEDLKHGYIRVVKQKWDKLEADFPGIAFYSEPFTGTQRVALPAFFYGCHCIAGGVDDGLGLASMENAYVNSRSGSDTTLIVGRGAGFAEQAVANGNGDLGFFPAVGDAKGFVAAYREAVRLQTASPGALRERTQKLVQREILPRQATMLVTRELLGL